MSLSLVQQGRHYEASSNVLIGSIHHLFSEIKHYPTLKATNQQLLRENAQLKSLLIKETKSLGKQHSRKQKNTRLIAAYVINNSVISTKNYLTLDKGALHGIVPGMGVVNAEGIVGRVKSVSKHFSTVISLLHTSSQVSARLANSGALGTVQWTGGGPFQAQLLYVPRHIHVTTGEAIVTSGYNATFLPGTPIGHVRNVVLKKEAPFYSIALTLSTDFSKLKQVYVVNKLLKPEKDALEKKTRGFYE